MIRKPTKRDIYTHNNTKQKKKKGKTARPLLTWYLTKLLFDLIFIKIKPKVEKKRKENYLQKKKSAKIVYKFHYKRKEKDKKMK